MGNNSIYDEMSHAPCDAFDFKENVPGESSNLDGRTRRLVVSKELGIGVIDDDKVVHVLQEQLSSQKKTQYTRIHTIRGG